MPGETPRHLGANTAREWAPMAHREGCQQQRRPGSDHGCSERAVQRRLARRRQP